MPSVPVTVGFGRTFREIRVYKPASSLAPVVSVKNADKIVTGLMAAPQVIEFIP